MASAAGKNPEIFFHRNRGRNGTDMPADILPDQVCEALNMTLEKNILGRKRYGAATQTITGTFTGENQMARYIPGQDETAAQLVIVDRSATTKIGTVAAGTAFANLTLSDNVSARPQDAVFAILNSKCYIAYDSTVNRLHVYDYNLSSSTVRRVGLPPPAAPSVANTGSGSYTATIRYYKVQWRVLVGSTIQRQGNLSAATSFTPSGSGTAARVTKPTASGEGETHWVVYGSVDGNAYYLLSSNIVVATTTYDDSAAPSTYSANEAAPVSGVNTPWPSVKFILSTGTRLLGFGVYEATTAPGDSVVPYPGRVYFSPVLNTTDADDDETVSDDSSGLSETGEGWIDVGRNSGAEDRAIAGPIDGNIFVYQSRGSYMLLDTGEADQPYERVTLSPVIGAVNQWSTFLGEDENGAPCVYWLDPNRGPYRYGAQGMQWCGYDVRDLWLTVNLDATTKVAHGVYDPDTRACYWWVATGSANDPDRMLVFYVREGETVDNDGVRYGWVTWTGDVATARCSVMFSRTIGATMSRALNPYAGLASSLLRVNDSASTADGATTFQSYITSGAFVLNPIHFNKTLGRSYLQAKTTAGSVTIRQTLSQDYGAETVRTADIDIQVEGSETRRLSKFIATDLTDFSTFQVTLGDTAAISNAWTLDEWMATVDLNGER